MAANANESAAKRSGHWAVHHVQAVTAGTPSAEPTHRSRCGPRTSSATTSAALATEREDDHECDEPLAHEPSLRPSVERRVGPA